MIRGIDIGYRSIFNGKERGEETEKRLIDRTSSMWMYRKRVAEPV